MGLNLDQIFDAADDDEAFERLARTVARHGDADVAVLHWRSRDEPIENDMPVVDAANAAPPCASVSANGLADDRARSEGTGSHDSFGVWMASLGDASPHCISKTFDRGDMTLAIGLRRGPDQVPFDDDASQRLQSMGQPIISVIAARDRLTAARYERALLETALDALGSGVLMLSRSGNVRFANAAARRMLSRGDGFIMRGQRLQPSLPEDALRLSDTLSRMGVGDVPDVASLAIQRRGLKPYLVSLSLSGDTDKGAVMAVFNDPDHVDHSLPSRLRSLFGLGHAEAEIACALAEGEDLEAIAIARSTSIGTVRNQLKAISAKMNCSRQSEIVAIIRSLPSINTVTDVTSKKRPKGDHGFDSRIISAQKSPPRNHASAMPLR